MDLTLRDKQLLRILIQEAIVNPAYVTYYLNIDLKSAAKPEFSLLKKIIEDVKHDTELIEDRVLLIPNNNESESIVKKIFLRSIEARKVKIYT